MTDRGLDEAHWRQHNEELYAALSDPALQPYVINVFKQDGTYKSEDLLYDQVTEKIQW